MQALVMNLALLLPLAVAPVPTCPLVEPAPQPADALLSMELELDDPFELMNNEAIAGWLKVGTDEATVLDKLSTPAETGPVEYWAAIGTYVQAWAYPDQGIYLYMEAEQPDAEQRVLRVRLIAPATVTTERGIGIGSTEAAVREAYGDEEERFEGSPDHVFVAGTIYGGVIMVFENGRVNELFLGALAE